MGNFSKAVLIASVALCLHLSAFSQDISLKAKQITVKEAIELLKEKSGYSFVFSSADVNTNKRISISTDKATIDDVVKQILQGQNNLTYEIQNKRIIVKKIQPEGKTKSKRVKAIGKVVDDAGSLSSVRLSESREQPTERLPVLTAAFRWTLRIMPIWKYLTSAMRHAK